MSGFGKNPKSEPPALLPGNPGIGVERQLTFATPLGEWWEHVNVLEIAAQALSKRGYQVTCEEYWLCHNESGFLLSPQIAGFEPLEQGGVRTVTTMQINHPTLVPGGIFEYQHSADDSALVSILNGFDQWVQTDFATLLDVLHPTPRTCTSMVLTLPSNDVQPKRTRRAVLGPVAHFRQHLPVTDTLEEHPFCPCCLLTRSYEAFRELFEGEGFFGLRLLALRDEAGVVGADCRVNGEDFVKGAEALKEYATSWPPAGYELRQQYVVLHTPDDDLIAQMPKDS